MKKIDKNDNRISSLFKKMRWWIPK
jgi:hypothetical protein